MTFQSLCIHYKNWNLHNLWNFIRHVLRKPYQARNDKGWKQRWLRELCTLDVSTSEVWTATFDLRDVLPAGCFTCRMFPLWMFALQDVWPAGCFHFGCLTCRMFDLRDVCTAGCLHCGMFALRMFYLRIFYLRMFYLRILIPYPYKWQLLEWFGTQYAICT